MDVTGYLAEYCGAVGPNGGGFKESYKRVVLIPLSGVSSFAKVESGRGGPITKTPSVPGSSAAHALQFD